MMGVPKVERHGRYLVVRVLTEDVVPDVVAALAPLGERTVLTAAQHAERAERDQKFREDMTKRSGEILGGPT